MLSRAILPLILALQLPPSTTQPGYEKDLRARHDALIQQNGPGTDTLLRDQLLAMRDQDQEARGMVHGEVKDKSHYAQAPDIAHTDSELTARLKQITETRGWPTIRLVGIDASNAAVLILTHSPDHAWQHTLLPQLEELADTGRIDGSALATVIDKELIASGNLQRYGSQFKFVDGAMAMYAVEDPANLDRRRAQVMLIPMDAYKSLMSDMYHLPVSSRIISPSPPKPTPPQP